MHCAPNDANETSLSPNNYLPSRLYIVQFDCRKEEKQNERQKYSELAPYCSEIWPNYADHKCHLKKNHAPPRTTQILKGLETSKSSKMNNHEVHVEYKTLQMPMTKSND